MILAVLDDLMFASKIRTTAGQLGVSVSYVRTRDAALERLSAAKTQTADPLTLVVLDLNNTRTEPLAVVAAMHADPLLRTVPTIGFVSHVQTEVIEAARSAGVTHVVARSAFVQRLADLLTNAS